jgi:nucleotide-binding universal stress UspA family protein
MTIKKILFPVDFTSTSTKIIPYVKEMMEKFGADVELVHVVRGSEEFAGFEMGAAWYSTLEKDLLKGAEKAMERFIDEHFDGVQNVSSKIIVGNIVDELVSYSEQNDIDMIIIGTHARQGLEKIMFGSVAEGVVKKASCPVLTIRP